MVHFERGPGPHTPVWGEVRQGGAAALRSVLARALLALALVSVPLAAWAHAFPDHSEPRVGHSVDPPRSVRVWFDGAIEPVFSTIRVEDGDKRQVDSGDARVNPGDSTLLEVTVPVLPPGRYQVFWSVVARDGHRTEGSFPFRVK
jgi:methionine-rich copper-binding protein CopC